MLSADGLGFRSVRGPGIAVFHLDNGVLDSRDRVSGTESSVRFGRMIHCSRHDQSVRSMV
jgi:hypothetical protein